MSRQTSQNETRFSELMTKAQSGDSNAYHLLLSGLGEFLQNYLKRKIFDEKDREDIMQDCLISVHKSRHTYDPQKSFMSWFLAITQYKCIDYYRKKKFTEEEINLNTLETSFEVQDDSVLEDVQSALDKIDPTQRQVVDLLKFQGLKIKEVSIKTGLSESNVKVIAHRAYKELKKHLQAKYGDSYGSK